jgi:hypothetical protein
MMGLYSCGGMPGNSSGSGLSLGWQVCLTVPVTAPKYKCGAAACLCLPAVAGFLAVGP